MVTAAVCVVLRDVDVFACQPPGNSCEEWQLLSEERDASLLQVGRDACRAERRVVQGTLQRLLELLDVRCAVRIAQYPNDVLYADAVVVGSVV